MIVLYRDQRGRFICKRSARRRKPENVRTELRETVRGKSLRIVKGYHERLRRPPSAVKKKIRKILVPPSIRPARPRSKVPEAEPEEAEEPGDEPYDPGFPEEEDFEPLYPEEAQALYPGDDEDIADWQDFSSGDDHFDAFLQRLDDLDEIEDYDTDSEWYTEG